MLLTLCVVLLFLFVLLGMDIAFAIGVAALAFIVGSQFDARPLNPVLFVKELTSGVDSFAMLAIPMYIFVGELMTKAGVAVTCRGRRHDVLSESPVPEIGTPGSMSGVWKRCYGGVNPTCLRQSAPLLERGSEGVCRADVTTPPAVSGRRWDQSPEYGRLV